MSSQLIGTFIVLLCVATIIQSYLHLTTIHRNVINNLNYKKKVETNMTLNSGKILPENDDNSTVSVPTNSTGPKPRPSGAYVGNFDLYKKRKHLHSTVIDELGLLLFF
jgi:hypothetical protein